MHAKSISIRPFIGAEDFDLTRAFYHDLGFEESVINDRMSLFRINERLGFYLQRYYVKDWVDNSMIFVEVPDVQEYYLELKELCLPEKYPGVRLSKIVEDYWGWECFLHDPSGVLWHFGTFRK